MNVKNYISITALLTVMACTNSSQQGTVPNPNGNTSQGPQKGASGATTGQQQDDHSSAGSGHTHDDPDSDETGTPQGSIVPKGPATTPSTNGSSSAANQPVDPNTVQFTIPAGTGRQAWNSQANPIRVKQGQTLVIKNADSQMHWIHTNFSPFPHPSQGIAPGSSASYRISGTSAAGLRDHLTNAPIHMTISK